MNESFYVLSFALLGCFAILLFLRVSLDIWQLLVAIQLLLVLTAPEKKTKERPITNYGCWWLSVSFPAFSLIWAYFILDIIIVLYYVK